LPVFGQIFAIDADSGHPQDVSDAELTRHVGRSTGLSPGEAERVVGEILAWYAETAEDFVRRRHSELQLVGTRNQLAYDLIAAELAQRLVRPEALTERQIRRIIYG
jgi:hypothetical protein